MPDLKTLKSLVRLAKLNKIESLKFGEIEFTLAPQGLITKSEEKKIQNILSATPKSEKDRLKEYESDLFYSAL